jgi:hypothetical protein
MPIIAPQIVKVKTAPIIIRNQPVMMAVDRPARIAPGFAMGCVDTEDHLDLIFSFAC